MKNLKMIFMVSVAVVFASVHTKVLAQDDADLAPPVDAAAEAPAAAEGASEPPAAPAEDVYSAGTSDEGAAKVKKESKPKKTKAKKKKSAEADDAEVAKTKTEESEAKPSESKEAKPAEAAPAPAAAAPETAPVAAAPVPAAAPAVVLADGSRITIEGKGFSIIPPKGWEIIRDNPSLSLLTQIPKAPDQKYQRNIQVNVFPDAQYIDSFTAQEVEEKIVKNFSQVAGVVDYKIRNHSDAQMADGRKGHLIYTEFKLNQLNMMQALVIVTTATKNYLISFTDVAETFEQQNNNNSPILNEAWGSMTSIELDGPTPERFGLMIVIGGAIGALLVIGVLVSFIRRIRSSRLYNDFDGVAEVSEMGSKIDSDVDTGDVDMKSAVSDFSDKVHTSSISRLSRFDEGQPPMSSLSKYDSAVATNFKASKTDFDKKLPPPSPPKKKK